MSNSAPKEGVLTPTSEHLGGWRAATMAARVRLQGSGSFPEEAEPWSEAPGAASVLSACSNFPSYFIFSVQLQGQPDGAIPDSQTSNKALAKGPLCSCLSELLNRSLIPHATMPYITKNQLEKEYSRKKYLLWVFYSLCYTTYTQLKA